MPNWCENVVTFTHRDAKQITKLVNGYNRGRLMSNFFPCPEELKNTISGGYRAGSDEQVALEAKEKANLAVFGSRNWYDWQCEHWGTKWDTGRNNCEDKVTIKRGAKEVTLSFDTAWSPPITFYEKMFGEERFEIKALYLEQGAGFAGIWESGEDQFFDFSGCPEGKNATAWIEEQLPKELIDEFDLLARYAEQD